MKTVSNDPLKERLRVAFEKECASSGLAGEIQARLRQESADLQSAGPGAAGLEGSGSDGGSLSGRGKTAGFQKWVVPLGMAAAIAFVLLGSTLFEKAELLGPKNAFEAKFVSASRAQHLACTQMGLKHHMAGLPRNAAGSGTRLSTDLSLKVMAPDLSKQGFNFQSADRCGLNGVAGAHLVYERISDGRLLSIFTISKVFGIKPTKGFQDRYVCDGGGMTVVAWQGGSETYVFCGALGVEDMSRLIAQIR